MEQTEKARIIIKTNISQILQKAGTSARIIIFGSIARDDCIMNDDQNYIVAST